MVLYIVLDFGSWTTFVQVFKVEVFDDEDAPERSQEHHVEEMSWDLSQSTVKLYRGNREHSSDWLRTDGLISSANEKRVH